MLQLRKCENSLFFMYSGLELNLELDTCCPMDFDYVYFIGSNWIEY
jgi:hypothetical protein